MTLYIVILLHRRDYGDPDMNVFKNWYQAYQFAMDKVLEFELQDELQVEAEYCDIVKCNCWSVMDCFKAVYFKTFQLT